MTEDEKPDLASADWQKRRKENHRDYLIAKGEDVRDEEIETDNQEGDL